MKKLTKQRITAPLLALSPMAVYFGGAFLVGFCASFVGSFMGMTVDEVTNMPLLTDGWLDEIGMAIAALFACSLVKKRGNGGIKRALRTKGFDFSVPIVVTVFTFACGTLCDQLIGALLSGVMTVEPNRSVELGFAGLFVTAVCAPIFEEIIFRYAAVEFARGAYSMPIICIANGLFFAAVHGYNIQGFLQIFIMGGVMAYVYCKTENILYTILIHALHNACCFIPLDAVSYLKNGFVLSEWYWVMINGVVAAACLVWYFKVFRKKYRGNNFRVNRGTVSGNEQSVQAMQTF
ncbi:MAG: CPBP family intramembrane metalloprotease [Ruminococcus sp.]|nr:CPBP family intramembrane metalloprotease [Ruminococcus sp.]MCM1381508.1 CPBP family intramembrane metalloprotease [Muribaculaceae bacterium]MCM1480868.1 CPBP family intramembrane metalloprotease [Muribaculaceae bacterium]